MSFKHFSLRDTLGATLPLSRRIPHYHSNTVFFPWFPNF
nr:MAG TPA: hypothetical protein [Caudoviricetes sp.]